MQAIKRKLISLNQIILQANILVVGKILKPIYEEYILSGNTGPIQNLTILCM